LVEEWAALEMQPIFFRKGLNMKIDRRSVLALSGGVLAAGLLPAVRAVAAAGIKSLALIEPLGRPHVGRTALDLVRPVLEKDLGCDVVIRTVPGHDGFDAVHAMLAASADGPALLETPLMATQYAETMDKPDVRIEDLTPIVKLTSGFSMALFAKRGSALKAWADLAAVKPLKVSSLPRATPTYLATLMMERQGGLALALTFRDTAAELLADVTEGRCDVATMPTFLLSAHLDEFQPIATFGAERNAVLKDTPTFGEIVGNRKLAFTESIGVLGAPKLDPALAARLTQAFIAAGQDPDVIDRAESAALPLAVGGPDVLGETMKRNARVLERILS